MAGRSASTAPAIPSIMHPSPSSRGRRCWNGLASISAAKRSYRQCGGGHGHRRSTALHHPGRPYRRYRLRHGRRQGPARRHASGHPAPRPTAIPMRWRRARGPSAASRPRVSRQDHARRPSAASRTAPSSTRDRIRAHNSVGQLRLTLRNTDFTTEPMDFFSTRALRDQRTGRAQDRPAASREPLK